MCFLFIASSQCEIVPSSKEGINMALRVGILTYSATSNQKGRDQDTNMSSMLLCKESL